MSINVQKLTKLFTFLLINNGIKKNIHKKVSFFNRKIELSAMFFNFYTPNFYHKLSTNNVI